MPKKKPSAPSGAKKKPIKSYTHKGKKRANNPPVGLVTPETDPDEGKKIYAYDPHLDPELTWAGKKEHLAFQDPTVSLHVHERIDPLTIIDAVKRKNDAHFVQIRENIHIVRQLLDEVFSKEHFASLITFQKTTGSPEVASAREGQNEIELCCARRAGCDSARGYRHTPPRMWL